MPIQQSTDGVDDEYLDVDMIESWEMLSADGDGFEIQITWKDPLKVST